MRKGTVLGQPTNNQNYVWTWYGRNASSCRSLCSTGISNADGTVCCAASCGSCGGCDCATYDGGADLCCPGTIAHSEVMCVASTDVGCLLGPYVPSTTSSCL